MTIKRCFKCLCEKSIDDFYKHQKMNDGRLGKCKECTKADANKHRLEKIEEIRSYDRMRAAMPHRIALNKSITQRWKLKYPERRSAQLALGNAVRNGSVAKQPCWVCGMKAQAHHPDYSRPLDVVWLCAPHHGQTHALV